MAKVKQRNTKPEMVLRKLLHARGWRYRLHVKALPGSPDLVFPARKAVVFVNGCFWHGHHCRLGRLPSSRPEYWVPKIEANRQRDKRKSEELLTLGWRVLTVWQCSLADKNVVVAQAEEFLCGDAAVSETSIKINL
jgi:DNA mismatch endonuclease (patch repair protein)